MRSPPELYPDHKDKKQESWAKPEHLKMNLRRGGGGANSIWSSVSGEYVDDDIPVYYRRRSHIHNTLQAHYIQEDFK